MAVALFLLTSCTKAQSVAHRSVSGAREEFRARLGVHPDGLVDGVQVAVLEADHALWVPTLANVPPAHLIKPLDYLCLNQDVSIIM